MKNKENLRQRRSQMKNKSVSYDRHKKKSNFSSMIFQSGKNSLCSPREALNMTNDKYKTYMQYVSSGKFMPECQEKQTYYIGKGKSITPTPRKISVSLIQHGRRSVMGKENPVSRSKDTSSSKQVNKTSQSKSKPLYVKGNNIIKCEQSLNKQRAKDSRPKSGKKKGKLQKTMTSTRNQQKEDEKQKKLLEKLFQGIQFYRDLGKGAHALVKSGVDWNNKRKIAIKVYDKKQLKDDELRSIQRQIEILGSLNSPHIIKLYEIIESFKTINLLMEYGGGNSVEQYLKNKKNGYIQQNQAKVIFKEVLEGISYLHDHKIAHRDIKSENILLNKYLKVKIIDFGFSLKMEHNALVHNFCGTPTYMAPEVVTKVPHNPFLADRWSLGILLYTMLNGHCPFKAQNQKELFVKIFEGEFQFQEHVSLDARMLISSFLRKKPEERISLGQVLKSKWISAE